MTSRERVIATLNMKDVDRIARDLWVLQWAEIHHPDEVKSVREKFPVDFGSSGFNPHLEDRRKGDWYRKGIYVDEWGCTFLNLEDGVIGEVKEPLLSDWSGLRDLHPPEFIIQELKKQRDEINRNCSGSDKFIIGGDYNLFERMQFLRGTENLYIDILEQEKEFFVLRDMLHEFWMRELREWLRTDIDAVSCFDDWGSQTSLLINPGLWRKLFEPFYQEYFQTAKKGGKYTFLHSDGYIFDIMEDVIEIGVDAVNSQIFCMDIGELGKRFKGRITFWGEIDRQYLLPRGTREEIFKAVETVKSNLMFGKGGGVIAQCEFGAGAKPENVSAIYEAWDESWA